MDQNPKGLNTSSPDPVSRFPSWISDRSFSVPRHLVSSAWIGHSPFLSWLIDAIRPRTFIELGTHAGYSYFAACQAVEESGLSTQCYAIDTWRGDEHAGFYGPEIYDEVSRYNRQHYDNFSTLVPMRFDEAAPTFEDESVDLLHIDGRHFYSDVADDFECWRPKLSRHAVVIMHDINVRERDFGVWRLWTELRDKYPTFSFNHNYGLGVLSTGDTHPYLAPLFDGTWPADSVRRSYARLGAGIEAMHQVKRLRASLSAESKKAAELEKRVVEDQTLAEADGPVTDNELIRNAATMAEQIVECGLQLREQRAAISARDRQLNDLEKELGSARIDLSALRIEYEGAQREVAACGKAEAQLRQTLASTQRELYRFRESTIWKATKPLRTLIDAAKGFGLQRG